MLALTLNVYNFFNVQVESTKLCDFSQNFNWKQLRVTRHCPSNLTLPWQPYFDRQISQNLTLTVFISKGFVINKQVKINVGKMK